MSTQGYAATSISHIRRETGLPASSIYWHFGSKEGVLAAVMERGAERYFAQIPRNSPDIETQRAAVAKLMVANPEFFRLMYMLSLERSDHPAVAAAIRRVRDTAISGFADVIRPMLPAGNRTRDGGPGRHRTRRRRHRDVRWHLLRRPPRAGLDRCRPHVLSD